MSYPSVTRPVISPITPGTPHALLLDMSAMMATKKNDALVDFSCQARAVVAYSSKKVSTDMNDLTTSEISILLDGACSSGNFGRATKLAGDLSARKDVRDFINLAIYTALDKFRGTEAFGQLTDRIEQINMNVENNIFRGSKVG